MKPNEDNPMVDIRPRTGRVYKLVEKTSELRLTDEEILKVHGNPDGLLEALYAAADERGRNELLRYQHDLLDAQLTKLQLLLDQRDRRIEELQGICGDWERLSREAIEQARQQERERIEEIVKDYFRLNWGEFQKKYPWIERSKIPGEEIWQALKDRK